MMGKEPIRVVSEDLYLLINKELDVLLKQSGANCALVIDKSGYTISSSGSVPWLKEDVGGLSAGIFMAIKSLIDIGFSRVLTITFHSPKVHNLRFSMLSSNTFLLILYRDGDKRKKLDEAAAEFTKKVKILIEKDTTKTDAFNSLSFIERKIDEILKNP